MGKENKSRYALLGMLNFGPMSGYDLKKIIEVSISNFWNESYAQIYPILKQLAQEGLATSHVEQQTGKPDRHVYTITEKGRSEFQRWLAEPVEMQVQRNEMLLKLFFGGYVPVPSSIEHMREVRETLLHNLERYGQIEASIQEEFAGTRNLPYWLITLSYGRHFTQALLAWCDETLVVLEKLAEQEHSETATQ